MKVVRRGLIYTAISYIAWGLSPAYWKLLLDVDLFTLVSHRMLWSFVFIIIVVRFVCWSEFKTLIRNRRALLILGMSGICVASTWWLFIYAVNSGQVLQSSLGYYINPLMAIAAGVFFFHEKLTTLQKIAVALATTGVLFFTIDYGSFPWLAISMALMFAIYGALKKKGGFAPLPALAVETTLVAPVAIVFVIMSFFMPENTLVADCASVDGWITLLLLVGGGLVTVLPLLWFAEGVNAIPLSWVGFLQFVAPTLSLLLGVFAFGEAFTFAHAVCFAFIWLGLGLISIEFARDARHNKGKALGDDGKPKEMTGDNQTIESSHHAD